MGKASFIHSSQRRWRNLPLVSQHKLEAKLCPATVPLRVPTGATPLPIAAHARVRSYGIGINIIHSPIYH